MKVELLTALLIIAFLATPTSDGLSIFGVTIPGLSLATTICHADDTNVSNTGRMSETEYVQDRTGKVIGSIVRQGNGITYVYDATGKIKGRCESGQTFDDTGALISHSEIPGMLIDR